MARKTDIRLVHVKDVSDIGLKFGNFNQHAKILAKLREYYAACKPKTWLFEGQKPGTPYDERSLASVLKQALAKTSIKKPVTLHWLRHSYATHLHESGTDICYIQELLGHKSTKTTEIYTHVSTSSIQKIISPFDSL